MEIDLSQPAFDFDATKPRAAGTFGPQTTQQMSRQLMSSHAPSFAAASLEQRRRAGLLDLSLLLLSFAVFWALFSGLGGHFTFSKLSFTVTMATLAVLYVQYFTLFSYFGGSTPGMMLCRLRVVGFDGGRPTPRQLLWRSFGYLVSAGTAALGFLWALWDEDHLTWHDRISQTYVVAAEAESAHSAGAIAAH